MNEISAKKLVGMPVFSVNDGEAFGQIKQLITDPVAKQLLAVVIGRRGHAKDTKIVAVSKIINIGSDMVTISEKNAAARAANLPKMVKYMHRPDNILGNRVISENGYRLGKAEEYYLDAASGKISSLEISASGRGSILAGKYRVDSKYILTIGPAAIVLEKKALDELEPIENPIKASLPSLKAKISKAAEKTKSGSQKISRSLSEKINVRKLNRENSDLSAAAAQSNETAADLETQSKAVELTVNNSETTTDTQSASVQAEIPADTELAADDLTAAESETPADTQSAAAQTEISADSELPTDDLTAAKSETAAGETETEKIKI